MSPRWAAALEHAGLPAWLIPRYFLFVAVSAVLTAAVALALARRNGADLQHESRSLLIAYAGACLGGYVLESLRAVPDAVTNRSLSSVLHVGRAAYGGLLFAIFAVSLYRRIVHQPIGAFLDRMSIGGGISFCLIRIGCFAAGCDYGTPTSWDLGVRFPAYSHAAMDHVSHGWIPMGRPSLPVHPTQLYESMLGLLSVGVATFLVRRLPQNGQTFLGWLMFYATGRFFIEYARGDVSRGVYRGLSSAQILSVLILTIGSILALRSRVASPTKTPQTSSRPSMHSPRMDVRFGLDQG